jgi:ferredoxin--NADP+ reductase
VILVHGCRHVAELAYEEVICSELPGNEYFGDQVREKLIYYPTVTREPFRNQGRIPTLMQSGKLARDIGLPPLCKDGDRFMLCGSPEMLRDTRVLFDGMDMAEGNMSHPGHFVIERAFVEK